MCVAEMLRTHIEVLSVSVLREMLRAGCRWKVWAKSGRYRASTIAWPTLISPWIGSTHQPWVASHQRSWAAVRDTAGAAPDLSRHLFSWSCALRPQPAFSIRLRACEEQATSAKHDSNNTAATSPQPGYVVSLRSATTIVHYCGLIRQSCGGLTLASRYRSEWLAAGQSGVEQL